MNSNFKNLWARIAGPFGKATPPQAGLDVTLEKQTRVCQLAARSLAGLDWHWLRKAEQELVNTLVDLGHLAPGVLDGFVGRETGKGQGYVLVKNVFTGAKMFSPNTGNLNEVRHHDGTCVYKIIGFAATTEEAKARLRAND